MALPGEWQAGAARGSDDVVMVTLGAGIGTAALMRGQLVRGKHRRADVLGDHLTVNDRAVIQIDDQITLHRAGDEVWIPVNGKHRLSCTGPNPILVLEIAFGNWQQSDITRYEDDYARAAQGD